MAPDLDHWQDPARPPRRPLLDHASPLLAHLSTGIELSPDDERLLRAATKSPRVLPAHADLIKEGDVLCGVKILLDGWAIAYRSLPNGSRQILALLLPGDVCVAHACTANCADHSVMSLTPVRIADVTMASFNRLVATSAGLARAFRWADMVTLSMQREWTMNIGQRDALTRVSHLLCETMTRMGARGLGGPAQWYFPPTQTDIAEAVGLTPVHVNRTLRTMREDGLVDLHGKTLTVLDGGRLRDTAMFDPAYLHGAKCDFGEG